ncbi:hypothetical protein QEJ31_10970 [Pigmentibacter sp. JX0631]|uniref:hypothetical protein n=1 Tax=Pigmentibacter sp. JX0631 TaxID=2976982 RepID=UPI0024696DCA|nr:hypothetical protein [Pigmentibacter sp. JX0631]WGL59040.1 hypothetical protein QEJ31_10970 [Pigmentibacter sp. JX0631]
MINDLFIEKIHNNYKLIICSEKIGSVYAYLLKEDKIISDLWLFNITSSPITEPWKEKKIPPFQNSIIYAIENEFNYSQIDETNYCIIFQQSLKNGIYAKILFSGFLIGIISENFKPGWSIFSKKNGPLAQRMVDFDEN